MANLSQQLALASLIAINLWGCTSGQPSAVSTTKAEAAGGKTAAIAQPAEPIVNAKRTVALSSLAADILYQLDPDKLVGVAHDRNVAQHADLSQYQNIGDGREFDVKAIIDLRPDLVVGIAGVHERILAQLEEAGIPIQRYRLDSWESLFTTIEDLARATSTDPTPLLDRYAALRSASTPEDAERSDRVEDADNHTDDSEQVSHSAALDNADRAAAITPTEDTEPETANAPATTDETTDTITDTTKTTVSEALKESGESKRSASESASDTSTDNPDRSSTLILASRDPLFSLNRKSWGGSAIEPFTHNIAADLDEQRSAAGYVTLAPEAILKADPDTILIVETPGSTAPIAEFESLPFWQDLRAVKNDRFSSWTTTASSSPQPSPTSTPRSSNSRIFSTCPSAPLAKSSQMGLMNAMFPSLTVPDLPNAPLANCPTVLQLA
ncbi:MAG: ABC transporter substrate-binding protein [Coleofasciculaceae cyanobacterium RL_1_1]|nr:ABC transporter substrate-binding protein [Coleofasciculaceae cyanobacterium RL_1_1]